MLKVLIWRNSKHRVRNTM